MLNRLRHLPSKPYHNQAHPLAESRHGFTAMHFAARAGRTPVVQRLLDDGVDINLPLNWSGPGGFRSPRKNSSPLILAIENAHFVLAAFLLGKGANIEIWNRLNAYNWSPLLIAQGYRRGNFKPSYETIAAIEAVMSAKGVTLRFDPPDASAGYSNVAN